MHKRTVLFGLWVASLTGLSQSTSSASARLVNAGFEATNGLPGWRAWIYQDGPKPTVRADSTQAHEGRQALLVEAEAPADVAMGQEMALPPASVWRARCWVRTEHLTARDRTDTGGALHIQTPGGATLARGASRFGTSAWTETDVLFRAPTDGRVKIVLFFVGYGKGTGRVWFDDVRLDSVDLAGHSRLRVTAGKLSTRPIDPKQGGQFIEPLCNLLPSLIAQQVWNTSFEEDPPWKVAFKREIDRPHRPWYPEGAVHLAQYAFDTNQAFNGQRSLRIGLEAPGVRAGISQDGFYLKAGVSYRLRLHYRSRSQVAVRATLHGGGGLAARPALLGRAPAQWQPAEAALRATRTLDNATLTLDFAGPGTLWLDRVSLIGDDAMLGLWRPDAVHAIRELRPGVIRFGGSALETYEWDQCVGPWDRRTPFAQTFWGGIEENFVGVEEFVQLCQAVGAEPLICVRWSGKRPADAAAEVQYFNGGATTPGGQLRASHGHPAPYRVRYWQIGNEVGGQAYDDSVRAFAQAMRAEDPTVRVLSSFPSEETLRAGGGYLDYLCPHHYGCADLPAMADNFRSLETQIRRWAAGRPVRIAVTEWNTTAGDWELGRGTLQTLANALSCSRYHQLMHRHADAVEIAIRSNLADSFGSGVIVTGPGWLFLAPTYYAQRLFARAAGSYPVRSEHRVDPGDVELPWPIAEPDLSAVWNPTTSTLRLYGVNSTITPLETELTLTGFSNRPTRATKHTLRDSEGGLTPEIMNSRDEPERVRVHTEAMKPGSPPRLSFPPLSLTLYELEFQGAVSRGASQ